MLARTKGHARIHLQHLLTRSRVILFPGWLDDKARGNGKGRKMLLPTAGPILIGKHFLFQFRQGLLVEGKEFAQGRLCFLADLLCLRLGFVLINGIHIKKTA